MSASHRLTATCMCLVLWPSHIVSCTVLGGSQQKYQNFLDAVQLKGWIAHDLMVSITLCGIFMDHYSAAAYTPFLLQSQLSLIPSYFPFRILFVLLLLSPWPCTPLPSGIPPSLLLLVFPTYRLGFNGIVRGTVFPLEMIHFLLNYTLLLPFNIIQGFF